jgi:two-component system chemotaxis sensor kinase CheA
MEELIAEFVAEAGESLDAVDEALVRLETRPDDIESLNAIFRVVHSVKGTSGFLGLARLESVGHAAETLLGRFRDGDLTASPDTVTLVLGAVDRIRTIMAALGAEGVEPAGDDAPLIAALEAAARGEAANSAPAAAAAAIAGAAALGGAATTADDPETTADAAAQEIGGARRGGTAEHAIRVGVDVLEDMMTLISELVLTRNQLLQVHRRQADEAFAAPLQRLSTITSELQDSIMKTRVQPIGAVWRKLPRVVRDLAREVGKDIRLEMEGETTELDRQVLELIRDPLTHMVRNSADHGLETPEARVAAGKPRTGTIRLAAAHESGSVVITVEDDGRGLDPVRIRDKAVAKGLIAAAESETMTDQQALRLIFAPGFSTAETVTNLSGRGVGMDVVRTNIEQIGGQIDVRSEPGRGASFRIRIPLTLAIMPVLIVGAGGQRFAVPQSAVVELARLREGGALRIEERGGARLMRLRDTLAPVVSLGEALRLDDDAAAPRFVMVADIGGRRFGLLVDEVLDTEEIVVKPLSARLRDLERFSGATILGDGSVVLIVDMNNVAALAGEPPQRDEEARLAEAWMEAVRAEDSAMLLVDVGGPCPAVIELDKVSRLEHAPAERIVEVGGRLAMRYRDRLTPVEPLGAVRIRRTGRQPLVVVGTGDAAVALAVDSITDILRAPLVVELCGDRPGLLGSALVNGGAVEVLDVEHHRQRAAERFAAPRGADGEIAA